MSMPVGPKSVESNEQVVTFHLPVSESSNSLQSTTKDTNEKIYSGHEAWFKAIADLKLFGSKDEMTRMKAKFQEVLQTNNDFELKTFLEKSDFVHPEQLAILQSISGQFLKNFPSMNKPAQILSNCLFEGELYSTDETLKSPLFMIKLMQKLDGLYGLQDREARRTARLNIKPEDKTYLKNPASPEQIRKTLRNSGVKLAEKKREDEQYVSESESDVDEDASVKKPLNTGSPVMTRRIGNLNEELPPPDLFLNGLRPQEKPTATMKEADLNPKLSEKKKAESDAESSDDDVTTTSKQLENLQFSSPDLTQDRSLLQNPYEDNSVKLGRSNHKEKS